MEPIAAADVISAVSGSPVGAHPPAFAGIATDTRTLKEGELFVALRGERHDAHEFLADAVDAGAAAALVERAPSRTPLPLIRVDSTQDALLKLAAFQRRRLRARVIAVTGSNGKTTTKDLIAAALSSRHRTVASPRSFNNFVGVPITLFLAEADTEFVVLEVGTNRPGEIDTLARVANPDVAVITNVAAAHLEGLGSLEGVLQEKGALLDHVREGGVCVLNRDDASFDALRARARERTVSCGVRKRADYVATMPVCDLERIAFHVNGRIKVRVPLMGCHNLYNSLMALAVASECGVDLEAAALSLRTFEGAPMRLKKRRRGRRLVIDDAYNANPGSTLAAVKTFAALEVPGRKILVLGDMLELGQAARAMHEDVGRGLSCGSFDLVAAVGEHARDILAGARECGYAEKQLLAFDDTDTCARDLPAHLREDDAVLVKGSRRMGLERVVERILAGASDGSDASVEVRT